MKDFFLMLLVLLVALVTAPIWLVLMMAQARVPKEHQAIDDGDGSHFVWNNHLG